MMDTETGAYGDALRSCPGTEDAPSLDIKRAGKPLLAVTRIRSTQPGFDISPRLPCGPAYIFDLHLGPRGAPEPLADIPACGPARHCMITISRAGPAANITTPIQAPCDIIRFYLPQAALDALADEWGAPNLRVCCPPGRRVMDPVIAGLGASLLPALEHTGTVAQGFVDQVGLAFLYHVAHVYGGLNRPARLLTGGLAPWQERRAKELLLANLRAGITLAELAGACGLSGSHFSRGFKQAVGVAPHRWLTEQRIEAARNLLENTSKTLAEISLAAGFTDQSHFTRVFTKIVGTAPGAWRRLRRR